MMKNLAPIVIGSPTHHNKQKKKNKKTKQNKKNQNKKTKTKNSIKNINTSNLVLIIGEHGSPPGLACCPYSRLSSLTTTHRQVSLSTGGSTKTHVSII
jgi:hypothetical protein